MTPQSNKSCRFAQCTLAPKKWWSWPRFIRNEGHGDTDSVVEVVHRSRELLDIHVCGWMYSSTSPRAALKKTLELAWLTNSSPGLLLTKSRRIRPRNKCPPVRS